MLRLLRSPFTAPGERGGRWGRALAETFGAGLVMLLIESGVGEISAPWPSPTLLAFGCLTLALLAVRRRWPTFSLLAVSAVLSVFLAAGLPAAVIAYTTARRLVPARRRTSVLLGATLVLMVLATGLAPVVGMGTPVYGLALGAVLAATTIVVPGLVGTSYGQQDRLVEALRERAAAAEEARRLADSESRTHERSRIAAEMHDLVGHRLSLISLHAGGLEMALDKQAPALRDEASVLRRATGDAMRELREVLGVLGPLSRDTGTEALTDSTGTRDDIEALVEESRRVGAPIDLVWDGPDVDGLPASVRRAVHRVVRECLTNVHRYAHGARVTVSVTHAEERIDLQVRNGVPPAPSAPITGLGTGRGLPGLRERVTLLGGTLTAGPLPGGGFAVTAHLPTAPDPAAATADPPEQTESGSDASSRPAQRPVRVERRFLSGLSGFLGLAGVGVMMFFGLFLVAAAEPGPARHGPSDPHVGMSREQVLEAVHGDSAVVRAAATGNEPEHPPGATSCLYPMATGEDVVSPPQTDGSAEGLTARPTEPTHYRITRYCFRGDRLAAIDRFTVPLVSTTPPWEAP